MLFLCMHSCIKSQILLYVHVGRAYISSMCTLDNITCPLFVSVSSDHWLLCVLQHHQELLYVRRSVWGSAGITLQMYNSSICIRYTFVIIFNSSTSPHSHFALDLKGSVVNQCLFTLVKMTGLQSYHSSDCFHIVSHFTLSYT